MAHGGGHGGGGGNNNTAVAGHVGLFTAMALVGGLFAAGWLIVTSPKTAAMCVIAALIFTGICPDPLAHPGLGLLGMIVGFCLVKGN